MIHFKVPVMLVANKCDMKDQRVVSAEQGECLLKKFGTRHGTYLETSARNKVNVDQIFIDLIRNIRASIPDENKKVKKASKCSLL